jgi:tRNA(His) guanylyltransferase
MSWSMIKTTESLVSEFNAEIGYTQSDEISLIFMFKSFESMMFGGKIQKLVSTITSKCTVEFYKQLLDRLPSHVVKSPTFDCRIWQVPSLTEACNYLIWRELDAKKNSISMLAQAHFSHKELHKQGQADMLDMLINIGVNWNDCPPFFKRGTYVQRPEYDKEIELPDGTTDMVKRSDVFPLKVEPLLKIDEREEFVFKRYFEKCKT